METYTIKLTERQMFLVIEGTNKITDSLWNVVPRALSDDLLKAVRNLDEEIDGLRRMLSNTKPDC